jgi:Cysteine-rich secretory protein family
MSSTFTRILTGAILALACALPALADVVHLTSGGIVRGEIVSETRRQVVVQTAGGRIVIPAHDVTRIERGSSPEEMYQTRLALIDPDDPEAHYSLAMWLQSIRADDLARQELLETVRLDPEHPFARSELGQVRVDGEWIERSVLDERRALEREEEEANSRENRSNSGGQSSRPAPTEVRGGSSELNEAMSALRSNDQAARTNALRLLSDVDGEVDRQVALLEDDGRRAEQAWGRLGRFDSAATRLREDALAMGDLDRDALRPIVRRYVEESLLPDVEAVVLGRARTLQRQCERALDAVQGMIRGYDRDDCGDRTDLLADWVEHRDAALVVIFDLQIYPDANHGRSGQPTVDEHVERVRAVWAPFDDQVQRDVAQLLRMSPDDAQELIGGFRDAVARLGELASFQDARGLLPTTPLELPAVYEVLVGYRGGDVSQMRRRGELNEWEQVLLFRLRDERIREHNASFATNPPDLYGGAGVAPSANEISQVRITNDYRIMMGRSALELDPRLAASARGHSADMTRLGFFDHMSPITEKRSPSQRMALAGYPGMGGENISLGSVSPQATHNAWYNSSGHHRNILGLTYSAMGSGQDGNHWTQNFGGQGTLPR